jgi:sulfite exporter TauE/SafE
MEPVGATLELGAALLAGLAASGHCVAMCGGIAGALAMRGARRAQGGSRLAQAFAYNLSRIASYAVAGAVAGLLGATLLRAVDVAPLSLAFRVLAGLVMLAAAARLLVGWRLLDPLEATGARLWRRLAPWASRWGRSDGLAGAVRLGLVWGWLPCGMTYSMLLLAATTASAGAGAGVMLAFGLGTLPSMVSATVAFERLARALATRAAVRNVAGSLLLAFGLWTAGNALHHAAAGSTHAHGPAALQPVESGPHEQHPHDRSQHTTFEHETAAARRPR